MAIINLTQHAATPEQIADGVVDLPPDLRATLTKLLAFDTLPTIHVIVERAQAIALLAATWLDSQPHPDKYGHGGTALAEALIGGAPFLMTPLEHTLIDHALEPVYAFSKRVSVEEPQPDGSVRKVNVFKHAGFVRVYEPYDFVQLRNGV